MKIAKKSNLSSKQHKILNQEGPPSFGKTYFQLCQLYSMPILTHVINHETDTLLLDVDRIHKDEEWTPIMMALKKNRDLVNIHIFSEASSVNKPAVKEVGNRFQQGNHSVKTIFRILPELMGYFKF
jgi:hypothetical protein